MRASHDNRKHVGNVHSRAGRQAEASRLSEREVRRSQRSSKTKDVLAREFGLSKWTVSAVRAGKLRADGSAT